MADPKQAPEDETIQGQTPKDEQPDTASDTAEDAVSQPSAPKKEPENEPEDAPEDGAEMDPEMDQGDQITGLESEIAALKDQLLRQKAETENVRRRAEKDKADAGQYAVTSFAREMLTVGDNLSRALSALPETVADDLKTVIEGVQMTERELLNIFERFGIKKVSPQAGDKFDPKEHQAMFEVPTDDHPTGSVVQVVAEGYLIKDRLLRPAMVGVAKGAAPKVDTEA